MIFGIYDTSRTKLLTVRVHNPNLVTLGASYRRFSNFMNEQAVLQPSVHHIL